MRAFVSHASQDSAFALELSRCLVPCFDQGVFYYEEYQRDAAGDGFLATINHELAVCEVLILMVGQKLANASSPQHSYQVTEANTFEVLRHKSGLRRYVFWIPIDGAELPSCVSSVEGAVRIDVPAQAKSMLGMPARSVAFAIVDALRLPWRAEDDLPFDPHLFSLENDIATFFQDLEKVDISLYESGSAASDNESLRRKILNGCPSSWPTVEYEPGTLKNPNDPEIVGQFRPIDSRVIVSARGIDAGSKLTFPEAGPRETLRYGIVGRTLRVALVVSGGIAPGVNAVIDGIVQRHTRYATDRYRLEIMGVHNGFSGLVPLRAVELRADETSRSASRGGSILATSRYEQLEGSRRQEELTEIARQLQTEEIDILYVIGGEGSMRAAHALWSTVEHLRATGGSQHRVSVIGVPKTMDNDILWVWQSFGFLSAVEKARETLEQLSNEVTSNPRVCVVQLFGSDSGFVVSHGVLASSMSVCDAALIPEVRYCTHALATHLVSAVRRRGHDRPARIVPSSMIVMAETAIPIDALDYEDLKEAGLTDEEKTELRRFDAIRRAKRRIAGRTPDDLRNAGLKIVKAALKRLVPRLVDLVALAHPRRAADVDWSMLRLFSSEPRHLLRAIPPNTVDLVTAQRLGLLAVDNALAGYTDFMISQWLTEYVLVPLKLVALGRKRIPEKGMFWKSVLSKTGQPARMVCDRCQAEDR